MSSQPNPSLVLSQSAPPDDTPIDPSSSLPLSAVDLDQLKKLPIDTLDTIRSKLVQLIDAIGTFRFQLDSSPLSPNSLPYPALISKFLILLNHTEALSQALNTPVPANPTHRLELPSVRAEREERSRWEDGPAKRSVLGNLAVTPRGLEGLEDGKEWTLGMLTRTKLAPEIEKDEQELLSLLPAPPSSDPPPTVSSLLTHVKSLTKAHEQHILNCRTALHKARHGRTDPMDLEDSSDEGGHEGDAKYEWKMRVEVDNQSFKAPAVAVEGPPSEDPIIKGLLGFMRDGRSPINQAVDGL